MKDKSIGSAVRYRIPAWLARLLWDFEEGSLVSGLHSDFDGWKDDRISDKHFLVGMEVYLRELSEFKARILTDELAEAIYDSRGKDVEWTENKPSADEVPF